MSWDDAFEGPVADFKTLRDAANYIQKLPAREQQQPHWQTAVAILIRAAEGESGWQMFATMAMLQALNHGRERVFSDSQGAPWGKRKLSIKGAAPS